MRIDYFPVILAGLMLTACAGKADFGRHRANEADHMASFVRGLADLGENQHSSIALTEDEKHLRASSQVLEGSKPGLAFSMNVSGWLASLIGQEPDPEIYYEQLQTTHQDSPDALLNTLGAHVHDDNALIDGFANQSVKVTKADTERLAAVQKEAAAGSLNRNTLIDRAVDVVFRVNENGEIMEATVTHLEHRLAAYKYALARARMEIPERDKLAVIEKAMGGLEKRLAGLRDDVGRHTAIVRHFFGSAASATTRANPEKSS